MRSKAIDTMVLWLTLGAVVATFHCGCGASVQEVAQSTLSTTAHALVETDSTLAPEYSMAHARALSESGSRQQYEHRMGPWNRVVQALRGVRVSLGVAQAALDAWVMHDDRRAWISTAPCVAAGVRTLVHALEALGVPIPHRLGRAVTLLAAFSGQCGGS